jgi:hypothetical protein
MRESVEFQFFSSDLHFGKSMNATSALKSTLPSKLTPERICPTAIIPSTISSTSSPIDYKGKKKKNHIFENGECSKLIALR